MYDVKSYYTQAKNMVLNLSEMEAKVREATNDDPWWVFMHTGQAPPLTPGAHHPPSCSRSQTGRTTSTSRHWLCVTPQGTHPSAQFNEIMPCIYSRFMEKEAREWRQIYKVASSLFTLPA